MRCSFYEDKNHQYRTYCFSAHCKTHDKSMNVIDFILHKENRVFLNKDKSKNNTFFMCEGYVWSVFFDN
ncbi:hypothetical protein CHRY9393_00933 [Chryseobacterium fistulae]|uniref:Uncharacterized protein n=1 Tax=Chryseobacterium fistulae TaxID=2675058 RepID=A0A6N4XR72_9FLAO|nr:hypothetical protein CHRY9393_00933 [Chryseobacterium fistulae]